jgi:hypothetical protein
MTADSRLTRPFSCSSHNILSLVCGDYTRRGLDCQLDLLGLNTGTLDYGVYTLHN